VSVFKPVVVFDKDLAIRLHGRDPSFPYVVEETHFVAYFECIRAHLPEISCYDCPNFSQNQTPHALHERFSNGSIRMGLCPGDGHGPIEDF
jgi:hypothetical protein